MSSGASPRTKSFRDQSKAVSFDPGGLQPLVKHCECRTRRCRRNYRLRMVTRPVMVNLRLVKLSTGVTNSNGPRTDLSIVRWRTPDDSSPVDTRSAPPQTRCTLNRTTHAGLGYTAGKSAPWETAFSTLPGPAYHPSPPSLRRHRPGRQPHQNSRVTKRPQSH